MNEKEELIVERDASGEEQDLNMPVPLFLKVTYVAVISVCIFFGIYFWGGSGCYFDGGLCRQLEIAAQTTTSE